ncbi:hypothetical protein Syun_023155 [Stephania yunnanensis]|uniref:Uncharacterized protein n=1 Tax=Stephania yunnanensis TaxID=152371 RepID=A0AAP0I3M2_9MAGN
MKKRKKPYNVEYKKSSSHPPTSLFSQPLYFPIMLDRKSSSHPPTLLCAPITNQPCVPTPKKKKTS